MKLRIIYIIAFLGLFVFEANSQCRTFAKKACESQLDDYMVSGRIYGGYMSQGQEIDIVVVLNGGQQYRLVNCTKPILGNIRVQLIDSDNNVVFDNVDHDFIRNWDFAVKSTQEFIIRTYIPSADKTATTVRDCSMVLIGSKTSS